LPASHDLTSSLSGSWSTKEYTFNISENADNCKWCRVNITHDIHFRKTRILLGDWTENTSYSDKLCRRATAPIPTKLCHDNVIRTLLSLLLTTDADFWKLLRVHSSPSLLSFPSFLICPPFFVPTSSLSHS